MATEQSRRKIRRTENERININGEQFCVCLLFINFRTRVIMLCSCSRRTCCGWTNRVHELIHIDVLWPIVWNSFHSCQFGDEKTNKKFKFDDCDGKIEKRNSPSRAIGPRKKENSLSSIDVNLYDDTVESLRIKDWMANERFNLLPNDCEIRCVRCTYARRVYNSLSPGQRIVSIECGWMRV